MGIGTNEGVLGIYEYRDNNRFAKLCQTRVTGTIYGLDWGPQAYDKREYSFIFHWFYIQSNYKCYLTTY